MVQEKRTKKFFSNEERKKCRIGVEKNAARVDNQSMKAETASNREQKKSPQIQFGGRLSKGRGEPWKSRKRFFNLCDGPKIVSLISYED